MSMFEVITICLLVWILYEIRFSNLEIRNSKKDWLKRSYEDDMRMFHMNVDEAARRHEKRKQSLAVRGVWPNIKRLCGIAWDLRALRKTQTAHIDKASNPQTVINHTLPDFGAQEAAGAQSPSVDQNGRVER